MHLLSVAQRARLEGYKNGKLHFDRVKATYVKYAGKVLQSLAEFPNAQNEQTRVALVAEFIKQLDP